MAGDISAGGYGNVPRAFMMDRNIRLPAKALYAYLSVYAGESLMALPDKTKVLYYLRISAASYERYMRELEQAGYITRRRRAENGRFVGTAIILNQTVSAGDANGTKPDAQISDTQNQDVQISDTQNQDTISNISLTKKNFNSNVIDQSICAHRKILVPPQTDGEMGEAEEERILNAS